MNEKESLEVRANEILKQLEEHPDQAVEISKEEAEYMGAFEDDSMSMEDALASHGFEINLEDQIRPEGEAKPKVKAKIVDAAETAAKGDFMDLPDPIFVCRGIKDD